MYNARIDCNINVAGMIENGQWRWPIKWYDQFHELKEMKAPTIDEHKQDNVMWLSNEQQIVKYSINRVWGDVCSQESKVDWHDVVWYPNFIPRHAFILWLLVHERLSTQDRLAKWLNKRRKLSMEGAFGIHQKLYLLRNHFGLVVKKLGFAATTTSMAKEKYQTVLEGKEKYKGGSYKTVIEEALNKAFILRVT
ncbi:reverse transcriptase zinc-binding domain-containing protein [Tanacetum coccineum]|uniref:Reverse transcriptase zinc-binding domain-containing protein n=1 Tax=Tanacetum coccineum TaxID=301880 RepID=A0ABQ5BIA7_9ASTR